MAARFGMVAAATLVAVVVLWVTLRFDGPAAPNPTPPTAEPDAPVVMPPGFDPAQTPEDDPAGVPVIREGERGVLRFEDATGRRITVLTYDRLTPQPAGVLDVQGLTLRVFSDTDRVLQITADRGTLIAPDNEPRQGDFVGDVVLTFLDGRGARPDLTADADVVLRAYMDEARYDLDLGRVETIGPIHLTGPRMDFVGREMTLNYNEARGRIERLEVVRGEALRLKPDAGQPPADPAAVRTPVPDPARTPDAGPTPPEAGAPPAEPTAPADAVQFYRARFEDAVRVRSAGDGLAFDGDYLEVVFSLRRGEDDPGALLPLSRRGGRLPAFAPLPARWPQHPLLATAAAAHWATLAQLPAASDDQAPAPAPSAAPTRPEPGPTDGQTPGPGPQPPAPDEDAQPIPGLGPTLAPPDPDDVVVRWTGRLIVEPEPTPPPDLAPGDNVQLRLIGRPAMARSADRQHLQGAEITYLSGRGRIGAAGTDAHPLLLTDPALGRLSGASLTIDPTTGTGFVIGPGSLHTADGPTADAADVPDEALSVTWAQRLDLTFDDAAAPGPGDGWSGPAGGVGQLRDAAFRGEVYAQHPRLALRADQLDVALAVGDAPGQIESIEAAGNVDVATRGEPDDRLTLRGDELALTTTPDAEGRLQPTALAARGGVRAAQPGVTLDADQLDVDLLPATDPSASRAEDDDRLRIRRLEARQAVRVELDDTGVVLSGDRLIAQPGDQRLELLGVPGEEAHISRGDDHLAGPRIIIEEPTRRVRVPAGGFLEALLSPGTSPTRLRVSWRDAMAYDDVSGEAVFDGAVRTTTHSASESTELTGDRLAVRFEPAEPEAPRQTTPAGGDMPAVTGDRRIAQLDATGRVVFAARSTAVTGTGRPETRLRLEGDALTFNQHRELVTVPGAGRMLLEDFRRDDADPDAGPAEPDASADPGIAFTGRGETLFVWGGQMVIDVGLTDSVMDGGVQMVHRPEGSEPVVQLDAQVLMVDLSSTGGMGVWQSDRAVDTDVELIRADGSVRIARETRQITADRLRYDGPGQELLLTADPGRFVVVADRDQPTPLRGRAVRWNLETGRLEVTEVTGGLAPIPGTSRP